MSDEPTGSDGRAAEATDADPVRPLGSEPEEPTATGKPESKPDSAGRRLVSAIREVVIIIVIALVAAALLRAFVVQAFYVPSGSMLPEIQLDDRILVSRINDLQRGEVVVFEDPGGWISADERPAPPTGFRKALEWVGVLPSSGHNHLVKRVVGLPGDHVVCCDANGKLVINGQPVDESDFVMPGSDPADDRDFNVIVPADHIFVLGDNRYDSGDSSRHLSGQDAFVPIDLVTGRAFAVIWPAGDAHIMHIPDAYDDVPDGRTPPKVGVIKAAGAGLP